jgi:hypothetical protein
MAGSTLHQARIAAQRVFTARLEGRDPAAEKRNARRRHVVDRIDSVVDAYITQHVARTRCARVRAAILRVNELTCSTVARASLTDAVTMTCAPTRLQRIGEVQRNKDFVLDNQDEASG